MLNKVSLIGNLGADPDVRNTQNGDKVANVSLATTERWKDQAGMQQERTEWHRVVFFGGVAGVVESYLKKGSKIYVEGKLQTRKWQDQQGQDRYTTEVVVSGFGGTMVMLDSAGSGAGASQNTYGADNAGGFGAGNAGGMQGGGVQGGGVQGGSDFGGAPASSTNLDDDIPF